MCSPSGLCATLAAMANARDVISIYLSNLVFLPPSAGAPRPRLRPQFTVPAAVSWRSPLPRLRHGKLPFLPPSAGSPPLQRLRHRSRAGRHCSTARHSLPGPGSPGRGPQAGPERQGPWLPAAGRPPSRGRSAPSTSSACGPPSRPPPRPSCPPGPTSHVRLCCLSRKARLG